MKKTIKVARFTESITYDPADIQHVGGDFYRCDGVGDDSGSEYTLTFDAFGNLAMVTYDEKI